MPPDSDRYYGFSYFAVQLNELLESEKEQLPCTDCRFRPDQQMLENGNVQDADAEKKRVEQVMVVNTLGIRTTKLGWCYCSIFAVLFAFFYFIHVQLLDQFRF